MPDPREEPVTPNQVQEPARHGTGGTPSVRPGAKAARRKQSDRSAETREKVIQAAIDCITELGFRRATATRIAARADVSWGAIQHQFGDKEAIFDAVIERGFGDLIDEMADLRNVPLPLGQRVAAFAERAWRIFDRPSYRAFVQVVLNRSEGASRAASPLPHAERIRLGLKALWGDLFGDLDVPQSRLRIAQRFTFTFLSGLALESIIAPHSHDFESQFLVLERALVRLLSESDEL